MLSYRDKILYGYSIVLILASSLSYFFLQADDPARCRNLLENGCWLNPSELLNWQPAGCMMHTYKAEESASCLKDRRVVFLGGTDALHLFNGFARKLDPEYSSLAVSEKTISSIISNVHFEYVQDPDVASAELGDIARSFGDSEVQPALTVIGIGSENLESWTSQIGAFIHELPSDVARKTMQKDRIVIVPPLLTQGPGALTKGSAPVPKTNEVFADILLNLRCNSQMPKHHPYASTCCNNYPNPSWVPIFGFVFFAILVPVAMALYYYECTVDSSKFLRLIPASKYLVSIIIMGAAVVVCYFCDRTNILGKAQKQTSPSQFFIIGGIIIIASLYTLKTSDKELTFLNRDQTDEWKGWMQIAILIYHYVGVSKTQYIYSYIRIAPASYLFMTGFGHTVYFLKKDDYSFKRFVATMLRLNLLNVLLAYAMGNDWLFYYFAPLVTWNFFVIYGIYWTGHQHNQNRTFIYAKIVIGNALNTAFYRTPGVLEFAWSILVRLFRMEGDMNEWRFRVTLDQYSVVPGMIAGILFIDWNSYSLPKSASWAMIQKSSIVASILVMLGYAIFEASQPSKTVYNQKHTYVAWLPCCAFVLLRNSSSWMRGTHNAFFAWVGRGSLETFLLQFHMWLAADTVGLLSVGPTRPINAVMTTIFFIWIASLVTTSTGTVIEWIMGVEPKTPSRVLPTSIGSNSGTELSLMKGFTTAENPDEKVTASDIREPDEMVDDAVPINGALVEVIEQPLEEARAGDSFATRLLNSTGDLRVRMGLIMAVMAFMNWTYYI